MSHVHPKWSAGLTRALPLEERLALIGTDGRIGARRAARARKVIARWKKQRPFGKEDAFARRLDQLGLDEVQLLRALEMAATRPLRDYVRKHRLWATFTRLGMREGSAPRADWDGHRGLLHLVQPLIDDAIAGFERDLAALPAAAVADAFDIEAVRACARDDLGARALGIIEKACLLELHIARLRGVLGGADSRARYRSFVRMLSGPRYARAFFRDYPVLLELLAIRIDFWRTNTHEIVARWLADRATVIEQIFGGSDPGRLLGWSGGMGDSHCGGRAVVTLRFESGRKMVYKPRSLKVDVGFNRLLDWCNEKLPDLPLRGARVIDRADYGWCEFIEHDELGAHDDASRFFHRQGKFLALFYALHAGDLHYENTIASGEHPVYVDLETLFHSIPNPRGETRAGASAPGWPITVAETMIISSVRPFAASVYHFDVSVLSLRNDQGLPMRGWSLVDAGTDQASLREVPALPDEPSHKPHFGGADIGFEAHTGDIRAGFVAMYEMLSANKDALLSGRGLRDWFRDATLRQVLRPTMVYAEFVQRSLHPDHLRDALERRALFERIFNAAPGNEWTNHLLPPEIADLERLDVPFFSRQFEDTRLFDSLGKPVAGIEFISPCDSVCAQIEGLNAVDMQAQLALIDFTFSSADAGNEVEMWTTPPPTPDATRMPEHGSVLEGAQQLADRLVARVIERGDARYWMCQGVTPSGGATMVSPGIVNVYSGQLGIALFVGMAGALSGNRRHLAAARDVLRTVRDWTDGGIANQAGLGVFTGVLGFPYVAINLAQAWSDDALLAGAFEWFSRFDPQRYTDDIDVIGGSAGGVLFLDRLLPLAERHGHGERLHALIEWFAERLLATRSPQRSGVGWLQSHQIDGTPLTGFAHGNAGIAAALYVAARRLQRPTLRELAREAIRYENAHYVSSLGNWADLREDRLLESHDPSHHGPMCAWCHGAAGILLGRAWCLGASDAHDPLAAELRRDLHAAERALANTAMTNDSLCHGFWGNHDVRVAAAALLPDEAALRQSNAADPFAMARVQQRYFLCGDAGRTAVDAAFVPPDVMTGMASVGYGLLRYADPVRVPSLLALDVLV